MGGEASPPIFLAGTCSRPILLSAMNFGKQLQQGMIIAVNPTLRTYDVQTGLNGSQETMFQSCVWAAESFGGLLGFKVDGILSAGTPVIVLPGSPHMIVKVLPFASVDSKSYNTRKFLDGSATADLYKNEETASGLHASGVANFPYTDLMEGEFVISNYIGVFAGFLTNLVKIGASESAKIECMLFDDMVRIVSRTFRHHSCLGDLEMFDDGSPSCVEDYTSRRHEAEGLLAQGDPVGTGDVLNFKMSATALRARFSRYTGWLGSFIHEIVTSPEDALGSLAQQRAGKSRFWRGEDGSVLVQGTGDIAIEYVTKVVVPIRKKRPDDTEGVSPDLVYAPQPLEKLWDYGPNYKDVAECAFQLREYARWLNQAFCMARFHAMENEWEVKTEAASPKPDYSDGDKNLKFLRQPNVEPPGRYACMRIFRGSGALMFVSGDGWSISSYDGDVYFDSPKNMHFRAAGDMHFISGGSISHLARKDVETFATYGGVKIRSRTCMDLLCEDGSIHIKTDAVDPETVDPPANTDHDDLSPAEARSHGIILESTKSKVAVHGHSGVEFENSGQEGGIKVKSSGGFSLSARDEVELGSLSGSVSLHSPAGDGKWTCRDLYLNPSGRVQVKNGQMVIEENTVKIFSLQTFRVSCKTSIVARSARLANLQTNTASSKSGKVGKSIGDVNLNEIDGEFDFKLSGPEIEYPRPSAYDLPPGDNRLPVWNMFKKESWIRKGERLMRTYTQERLDEDLSQDEQAMYGSWDLKQKIKLLRRHSRTGKTSTEAWGAWMKQEKLDSDMPPLTGDANKTGNDLLDKSPFTKADVVLKYLKP